MIYYALFGGVLQIHSSFKADLPGDVKERFGRCDVEMACLTLMWESHGKKKTFFPQLSHNRLDNSCGVIHLEFGHLGLLHVY